MSILPLVLVVDDEPLMRRALQRELQSEFAVLVADGPEEALRTLASASGLQAVVTDLEMPPGPGGLALLEEVRQRAPRCARIVVSGSLAAAPAALRQVAQRLVEKPWHRGEVADAVRGAISDLRGTEGVP